MKEIWKDVPDWEGYYQASNIGRVRSLPRIIIDGKRHKGKILSPYSLPSGYLKVNLSRGAKRTSKFMHALVLEAFVSPRPEGMEVRHLNGVNTDNRLENLCWGTPSENSLDTLRHGNHAETKKTHCPQGHILAAPNLVARRTRKCLSCARAHSHVYRYPECKSDFQMIADAYFEKLMKECPPHDHS